MKEMQRIIALLEEIYSDRLVPKNIRSSIEQAKKDLCNEKLEKNVRINSVISILDEAANDTNIPVYTRTQIMSIVSQLETINRG